MRIKEFSARCGLPYDTIRYYEKLGLLAPAREAGSNFKAYSDMDLERLELVGHAKRMGIPLRLISAHVARYESGELLPAELLELYREQQSLLQQKRKELEDSEAYLAQKIAKLEGR